jgi:hypothetical protein
MMPADPLPARSYPGVAPSCVGGKVPAGQIGRDWSRRRPEAGRANAVEVIGWSNRPNK